MRVTLLLFLFFATVATARPINPPSHSELHEKSDVILLLEVSDIQKSDKKTDKYPDPDFYQGYVAKCKVLSVLKGAHDKKELSIDFFQHPDGRPGFNGAIPAPLSLDKRVIYLAYLKRDGQENLVPVTGHYDAGLSIKTVLEHFDCRYLKLPKGEKKSEPAAAADRGQAPPPEA